MRKAQLTLLLLAALSVNVFSYSYTAFSLMTGEKNLAVNPFIYADGTGFVGMDLFAAYGMTEKSDIWIHGSFFNDGSTDFSAMLRYDIAKSNIIAFRVGHSYLSPQYHMIVENDKLALQSNVAAQFSYDYMDKPAFYAIISPVLKLFEGKIDVFVEANPGYYMQDGDFANLWVRPEGFGLDLVGGVGFAIGDCLFSIACPVYDVTNEATPTFGMWFFFSK